MHTALYRGDIDAMLKLLKPQCKDLTFTNREGVVAVKEALIEFDGWFGRNVTNPYFKMAKLMLFFRSVSGPVFCQGRVVMKALMD